MNEMCYLEERCGCENEKAWAVVSSKNKTLHRVTFSKSVAQQICNNSKDP